MRGQPLDAYQYEISPNTRCTQVEKAVVLIVHKYACQQLQVQAVRDFDDRVSLKEK